ncbi:MAG TPA: bifunctional riboflavin kinase/FAD synthetase [Methylophilaceae bacterium]|jgi:riboflavin kinase/FMN adenylyltransferase|nr:bifunctional riboflavin kinase/FAD synthetase [Methylophilaceae bacterium]HBO18394.1 bifunctional riboflavin kinase/FAD synthetase [Methylophilaceae bacterium]HCB67778.1 bifunctional riboflavin kinase/FAD synthetase [Methylophilaceae bacterium]HCC72748.1 bifunctional riboflavin kinase/FAD synthetase [Methylophilaceae bacterium]
MQVFRHFPLSSSTPIGLTIGNFDGVHIGHQVLIEKLIAESKKRKLTPSVMTFEPHPKEFFTPENAPTRLTTLREKLEFFLSYGIEKVFVCAFNQKFSNISSEVFMHQILKAQLKAELLIVGDDFRFGSKRQAGIDDLRKNAFELFEIPEIDVNGKRVSSTLIREDLKEGRIEEVNQFLGRPYTISGKVVEGDKRGRQMGFPTANIHMKHLRPALTGVYAVKLGNRNGVANLGVRPTISGTPKLLLEVHLLNFNEDIYGQHVQVTFLAKIRDEMKFENINLLIEQIKKDIAYATRYFEK